MISFSNTDEQLDELPARMAGIFGLIVWVLFALLVLVIYGYSFALVGNLLASPFYGLLAEKVSALENPDIKTEPLTFNTVLAIAGRSFNESCINCCIFYRELWQCCC
ncbi:MAG: hypothetical protein R3E73_14680 [Porticoccaceae bacterium]